ncbi:hypothetical protein AX14_009150 [Amanita brunnescens Koide BX004]|nr:hypothetical protein AX14_009150 [Amanita brunnescens Koide BX004]
MTAHSIPTELLYDIIDRAWAAPCNPIERIQLMTTWNRVSKSWTGVFDDIFSIDIHVPCKSFYYHLFNDISRDFSRCKTITFCVLPHRHHPVTLNYLTKFDMKKLASLHTMNILYFNAFFPDPYMEGFFLALTDFLPKLTVSYTFGPETSPHVIEGSRKRFVRESKVRYAQPKVGILEINGADEHICAIWESLFPTRGKLIRDGKEERHHLIPMSSHYDPIYGVPFLLNNWKREQEFMMRHPSRYVHGLHLRSDSPSTLLSGEDGWPLSPDVTRDSSVASTSSSQKRRNKMRTREEPTHFIQIKVHGVQVLATDALPAEKCSSAFSWTSVPKLGEVGYFSKTSGMFSSLFNAFEPHVVDFLTIPSLRGYGEVQVQSMKCGERVHDNVPQAQGYFADVTTPDSDTHGKPAKLGSDHPEIKEGGGGMARAKRAMCFLKAAGEKVVGGGKRMFKAKDPELSYIECNGKNVIETWFEENVEKILALYGRVQGISRENLVLVTGVIA